MKLKNKIGVGAGMLGLAAMGALGSVAMQSHADTVDTTTVAAATTTAATTSTAPAQRDPSLGGHMGANGVTEVLLTGDTASKVTAAALAAQPGATIERVETDAEGAVYEAHMKKADGSEVTVKFDTNYNVTATESGHGGR